jgi:hypothetical protein
VSSTLFSPRSIWTALVKVSGHCIVNETCQWVWVRYSSHSDDTYHVMHRKCNALSAADCSKTAVSDMKTSTYWVYADSLTKHAAQIGRRIHVPLFLHVVSSGGASNLCSVGAAFRIFAGAPTLLTEVVFLSPYMRMPGQCLTRHDSFLPYPFHPLLSNHPFVQWYPGVLTSQ